MKSIFIFLLIVIGYILNNMREYKNKRIVKDLSTGGEKEREAILAHWKNPTPEKNLVETVSTTPRVKIYQAQQQEAPKIEKRISDKRERRRKMILSHEVFSAPVSLR